MKLNQLHITVLTLGLAISTGTLSTFAAEKSAGGTPPPLPEATIAAARQFNNALIAAADRVKPAVVSVYSDKVIKMRRPEFNMPFGDEFFRFFGMDPETAPRRRQQQQQQQPRDREFKYHQGGMGSGIIINKDGHILTNNHVVDNVDEIKVALADKRILEAEIVGTDPKTDLAVIKIKGKVPADLPIAEFGNSDTARVGEMVIAIGAPFGYAQTITHGILSAKGRSMMGSDNYEDFLQTDAAINPGNSGGPLVNLEGKVIGINTAIATSVGQFGGVGFAIPSNMAQSIWPVLAKGAKISRGLLGVIIQNIDPDLKDQFKLTTTKGTVVSQVNKDSAADKAGVKVGDVIIRYNGKDVEDVRNLPNLVAGTSPNTAIELTVVRNGKELNLAAKLIELKADESETAPTGSNGDSSAPNLGLKVEPLTAENAKQLGLNKDDQGVVIREIEEDSSAARAGLRPGDLITEVNREKVTSVKELRDALKKSKDNVLVLVKSKEGSRFAILKPKTDKE